MFYAVVMGTVVASQKVDSLRGATFKVVQGCDRNQKRHGSMMVAFDGIGARTGDLVTCVGKREASLAPDDASLANDFPLDVAITGIVDAIG